MLELWNIRYTDAEIQAKRMVIAQELMLESANIKDVKFSRIAPADIQLLFNLYDKVFLKHQFQNSFQGNIKFSLSTRLSKTAGKTIYSKNIKRLKSAEIDLEIRLGTNFFLKFNDTAGEKSVAGIPVHNAVEALQLVFEHELCHVIEFISFHESNCRQKRFKRLSENLFGHKASTHQLPTKNQITEQQYGFKPGDIISFNYKGREIEGLIYRINKRATVMVKDKRGTHADQKGNRYTKFYVPLNLLKQL